jgi:mono/diheme cytochrome c family protein
MRTKRTVQGVVGVALRVGLGAVALASWSSSAWAGQSARQETVTFSKDIAPILQRSCQSCHRPPPGGGAPMSLLTYEEVRPWARSIKERTGRREMPPWFIEKNVGIQEFKDDPSLSEQEIALIARWVDAGSPRGNPADMPPPRQFPTGIEWTIGEPDLVVSSPVATVPAFGADWHGYWEPTKVALAEDRYIKSVEVHEVRVSRSSAGGARTGGLGGYSVIHHAGLTAGSEAGDEPGPVNALGSESFSMTHEAGQNATVFPDGLGVKLPARSSLAWRVHTHSFGEEVTVRLDVGFKFHPKGYTPKYNLRTSPIGGILSNNDLDIPANSDNIRFDAVAVLKTPAKLVSFEPHLHAGGKRMCVNATLPNGLVRTLTCAGYNHNWVKTYNYADHAAPLLPAGTALHVIAWYDNSTKNKNVIEPRNWHGIGSRSIDEMFFFLGRWVALTEDQYKEEVAARAARGSQQTTQQQQQQP